MGINVGDVVVEDGDIFGDGVNVAARLENLADPGGIYVSARVQEDAAGKLDLIFEHMGEQGLKNITRPVRVYRVRLGAIVSVLHPRPCAAIPQNNSGRRSSVIGQRSCCFGPDRRSRFGPAQAPHWVSTSMYFGGVASAGPTVLRLGRPLPARAHGATPPCEPGSTRSRRQLAVCSCLLPYRSRRCFSMEQYAPVPPG